MKAKPNGTVTMHVSASSDRAFLKKATDSSTALVGTYVVRVLMKSVSRALATKSKILVRPSAICERSAWAPRKTRPPITNTNPRLLKRLDGWKRSGRQSHHANPALSAIPAAKHVT